MLSQRRRHSRWRMFLVLLVFAGLIRHGELAPADVSESSSSSTPATKRKSQNIGSLSDFTWQAWLLVDTQTGSQPGMDSATLLRRITPKSVFIAPALPACADGYRADNMNRCVKSVNIDENAHFNFLLQRLNALYANQGSNSQASTSSKNEQKKSTGPLQLNIPLIPDSNSQSSKIELAESFSLNDPTAALLDETHLEEEDRKKIKPHEAVVTMYEIKNDTTLDDEEETTSFLENSDTRDINKTDQKPDAVVPVAEIVEETNDTSFSEVVDYKIPIDLKTLLNTSGMKRLNVSNIGGEGNMSTTDKQDNSTEVSPTLVLLLSPTKLPSEIPEIDNLSSAQNVTNVTNNDVIAQMSNLTSNITTKETIGSSTPDSYEFSSTWKLSEDPPVAAGKQRANETHADDESAPDSFRLNESHETEFVYDDEEDDDDEEYPYGTDMPDEESVEEREEILKHGEAGITIPTQVERLYRDQQRLQQQQNETTDDEKKTPGIRNRVTISFNDSSISTSADKDEAGSIVSSEVSIDGDLILETTLLDVNTEKLQVITKSSDVETHEDTKNSDSDSKESFKESNSSAPEVVFSPQNTHGTVSTSLHRRKQTENPVRFVQETHAENEKNEELEAAPSSSESLLYDSPDEDPTTDLIHTTDEKQSSATESTSKESSKDSDAALHRTFKSDVPVINFKQTSMNLGPAEDYVRFPDYARQPQQSGYVRFPSNEANSIHSQTYKQHSSYPADDVSYGSTSTKSSVPVRQKPIYHLTQSWKSNRPQSPDHVAAMIAQRQKQRPALLRFWNKMPLVKDPDVYPAVSFSTIESDEPTVQEEPRDRFHRRSSSRRGRSFTETPPQNVNRVPITRERLRTPLRD